jgi:NitT/TauT family transport system substrate-binding protein
MHKIAVVLLTLFVLQTAVHATDKIRISYPVPAVHFTTLPLAQKKAWFKEEGIDAEIIRVSDTAARAALVNGEIDYLTTIAVPVLAAVGGMPIKIVACYVPTIPIMLIARPEFKSVQDLKGKTTMVSGPGGGPTVIARMIFRHFGLDPEKDVKLLPGGSSDARLAVLSQGLVAATVVAPPFDFHAKKLGLNILARAHELFDYPVSGLSTTIKKIKERPDEIKRVIRVGIKASRYIRAEREGTVQFMMEWQKIDRETAAATYETASKIFNDDGSVPEKGLRLVIEEARKTAKVDRPVSVSDVADLSILREVQRELGIKGK